MKLILLIVLMPLSIYSQNHVNEHFKKFNYPDGEIEFIWKNGETQLRINILNKNLDGEYLSYHKNGNLWAKGQFIQGKINGPFKQYDKEGNLTTEILFRLDTLISYHEYQYSNGNLRYEKHLKVNAENLEIPVYQKVSESRRFLKYDATKTINLLSSTGYFISYYKNGQVHTKQSMVDNIPNGKGTSYHPNGNLWLELTMKNNLWDGEVLMYDKNGKLEDKAIWNEGKLAK